MAGLLGCDRHGRMLRGLGGLCPAARGTWSVGGMTAKTGGLQQQNGRLGSNSSQWGLSAPRQQHRENEKDREGVREEGIEVLLSLHRCPGWRYRVSTRPRERTCRSSRRLEEWKTEQKERETEISHGLCLFVRAADIYRGHTESTFCPFVCGRNSKLNSLYSQTYRWELSKAGEATLKLYQEEFFFLLLHCSGDWRSFFQNFLGEIKI